MEARNGEGVDSSLKERERESERAMVTRDREGKREIKSDGDKGKGEKVRDEQRGSMWSATVAGGRRHNWEFLNPKMGLASGLRK